MKNTVRKRVTYSKITGRHLRIACAFVLLSSVAPGGMSCPIRLAEGPLPKVDGVISPHEYDEGTTFLGFLKPQPPMFLKAGNEGTATFLTDGRTLYLNHFIASTGGEATVCGTRVRLELETGYPADGKVALKMSAERPVSFRLRVHQPNRAESKLYTAEPATPHGYRTFEVNLANESTVRFDLPLPLQRVTCDDRVAANRGLVAWQQGPIVYSWEGDGFKTRVPYHMRLNSGGPSRVWLPADGSAPTAETETGDWFRNTGCPLDASNAKVTSSCFLKER